MKSLCYSGNNNIKRQIVQTKLSDFFRPKKKIAKCEISVPEKNFHFEIENQKGSFLSPKLDNGRKYVKSCILKENSPVERALIFDSPSIDSNKNKTLKTTPFSPRQVKCAPLSKENLIPYNLLKLELNENDFQITNEHFVSETIFSQPTLSGSFIENSVSIQPLSPEIMSQPILDKIDKLSLSRFELSPEISSKTHRFKTPNSNIKNGTCEAFDKTPQTESPILPFKTNKIFPEILPEIVGRLLKGDFRDKIDHFCIIDCRYLYEYNGGHIHGSINLFTEDKIRQFYLSNRSNIKARIAFIFHCEYSQTRAPRIARAFRQLDREHNIYPNVTFPQVFIMNGGYQRFYNEAVQYDWMKSFCVPFSYVRMSEVNCDSRPNVKQKAKSRRFLTRSSSFALSPSWPRVLNLSNRFRTDSGR